MADALWRVISDGDADIADMLIFLPSRRAVRTVEKMIADKKGGAAVLPRLVALGEGADPSDFDDDDTPAADDVVPDILRVCVAAKLLAADANIANIGAALPVARDLIRMTDYLENEGVNVTGLDWAALVGEKYAAHFQAKAQMLNIIAGVMPQCGAGRMTRASRRNADIRAWIDVINKGNFSRIIVCASTASVPATADLMAAVARMANGRILLPGKISGDTADFVLDTNPYNSEYKFLQRIGVPPSDVIEIDVGPSNIDFFNRAFGNSISGETTDLPGCALIECAREAEEAAAAVEIAARASADGKSVLIITPDAAANGRLRAMFAARGVSADFSSGISGAMSPAGRAILNMLDAWIERDDNTFERMYASAGGDLMRMISNAVEANVPELQPAIDIDDASSAPVWMALDELSQALAATGIEVGAHDARAFVADTLAGVSLRPPMDDSARICVLGTIESRMQTADVVILTGLNEGMFPARGYENAWLPRGVSAAVGLPTADRKVSLMALDFMNLSCGPRVYWLRSKMSGGTQTTESRFLSRVCAHGGVFDRAAAMDILGTVRGRDMPPARPLNPGAAAPGADWSEVYVTELELLIHNPYAFYARHILRLHPMDDWWVGPDARTFGNLVHDVIEHADGLSAPAIVAMMDARARDIVGTRSVLFHFWHRRFLEIAPIVADVLAAAPGRAEIAGAVRIPVGNVGARTVRARADRVSDGMVIDIKTGAAPSKKQLTDGTMPQLPLEAYMLQQGGFAAAPSKNNPSPEMMFLQLRSGDVRAITYDAATTAEMMAAALDKVTDLFRQYTAGAAEYEYRVQNDAKYRAYDDLARVDD